MSDRPVTNDVSAGSQYTAARINENFAILEAAIEGCLGRGGTSENPNSMQGDLDMNTHDLLNVGNLNGVGIDQLVGVAEYTETNGPAILATGAQVAADAIQTAADRVQTGEDVVTISIMKDDVDAVASLVNDTTNFKGLWSELTGALAVPASVYHNDRYWILLTDLVDVTAAEPGISASWGIPGSYASVGGSVTQTFDVANATADTHAINRQTGDGRYVDQTSDTGAANIPTGTTAQRPTPAEGMLRLNTTEGFFEGYANGAWGTIAGEPWYEGIPDVVAVGESLTIPTGRTVVHPNLTVDGTLTIEGTLFVPSGGSITSATVGKNVFTKTDSTTPAFTKTGAFTVSTSQQFYVEVANKILTIPSSTVVAMPSPTVGQDYAIWAHPDGTLQATADFVTPPVANARKIGGFHYAPGGNAASQAGGDSVAQINEYSLYDLNYRPATSDPRGMTCVAGSFWADIYLLNTNPDANGTSSYNKTIADGSSPPIIPAALGGNGTTNYGGLTWFEAASIAAAMGKKMFGQPEFMAATYGVTEETSRGTDPVTTGLDAPRTSKWGLMQATGNLWTWAADRGGPFAAAAWNANTEGFGSEYNAPNAPILGASWGDGVLAGSRSSRWSFAASTSGNAIGLRLRCDHYQAD